MPGAPRCRVVAVDVRRRAWSLRLPFHYGVVTLREASEAHLRCEIETADGARATGYAAELAAPKWFNKSPQLSADDTAERLHAAVGIAARLAPGLPGLRSVAGLAADLGTALAGDTDSIRSGLNGLERSFAVALVERAVIDALCRLHNLPFARFVAADGLGLAPLEATKGWDTGRWLAALEPVSHMPVRHTVGLDDPLTRDDIGTDPAPGRPVALQDVIAHDGLRRFKVKFDGRAGTGERLARLARVLDAACPDYSITLDANEAFADTASFADALTVFHEDAALRRFWQRVRLIEQPLHRDVALATDVGALTERPLMIDESDDADDAFERALALGYRGVSIKTCKGVTRAVLNAMRVAQERAEGRDAFLSAEDLCVQPGIALQQNLALASLLGLPDAERNGHHFGPGPSALPDAERAALETAHADVYRDGQIVITDGSISTASAVAAYGFGTAVSPVLDLTMPRHLALA